LKNIFSLAGKKIASPIDKLNDKLTSYRLVLYFLIALVGWAFIGSLLNKVPYDGTAVLVSVSALLAICWLTNKVISKFLDIPANKESDLITALILALVLTPPKNVHDLAILAACGVAAITSKYVITYNKSHLFNPAATGAFVAGELFHKYPSWWVGTKFITPVVVVGGLLILRKMKRFTMVGVFLGTFILYLIYGTNSGGDIHFLWLELISTQVLFFAVVMLTEPMTSPTKTIKIIPYAVLVGIFYSVTRLKFSPEEALLLGNLFTFIVSRNRRYELRFVNKIKEAEGIFSYIFSKPPRFSFVPGQYMEWTVARNKTDSRGNRRYLTISASPTEPGLLFTVKFPTQKPSAFKAKLNQLRPGDKILASHLAGSFTLPKDSSKKIALLAGGVGITPFRSMAKYMIDTKEKRDVALIYSANSDSEFAFRKLFSQAGEFGLKSFYISGEHVDQDRLKSLLPDFAQRRFYISGPYGFVNVIEESLLKMGVGPSDIATDYFPGYGA
jgi:ferredoxin-NADP reductase/Na+-translocating ferredoxin:NAD+ oxidoreductase RnfD subunit